MNILRARRNLLIYLLCSGLCCLIAVLSFYFIRRTSSQIVAAPIIAPVTSPVSINQHGYLTNAPHLGMLAVTDNLVRNWQLIDTTTNLIACSGQTSPGIYDPQSLQTIVTADFSACQTPGTYTLQIDTDISPEFIIGDDVYAQLSVDAMRYYYLNRSGIPLDAAHAGAQARSAGHLSDNDVTCYPVRCNYVLDGSGGWYDAGDYGKYIVNGGISVWTLLNLYERTPGAFPDNSLNIPEGGNGVPDILDEVRWELEFFLKMQVPAGEVQAGMVHHMITNLEPGQIPQLPPQNYDNDNTFASATTGRYISAVSSTATYNLVATAAQCGRIWQGIDNAFAQECLDAAQIAFAAAQQNPVNAARCVTYEDNIVTDEMFWGATELYITTGDPQYLDVMFRTPQYLNSFIDINSNSPVSWRDTATAGVLSLMLHDVPLPPGTRTAFQDHLIQVANAYLNRLNNSVFRVSIDAFYWGSNSEILNNAILFAYAHGLTGDQQYLDAITASMDYLLGRNAPGYSFVSGYGMYALSHPHHSFWADQGSYPPPPPGAVTGGANAFPDDPTALANIPANTAPAFSYIDQINSWSTNEVAINYNAPLVWVSTYIDAYNSGQIVMLPPLTSTTLSPVDGNGTLPVTGASSPDNCDPNSQVAAVQATDITATANIDIFDPALSKLGILLPGELGITGERLQWIVTVSNNSSGIGHNVIFTDVLRDELRIDTITTTKGTVSVIGQEARVVIGDMPPGDLVTIVIETTVLQGNVSIDNTACVTDDDTDEECITSNSLIGVRVDVLPATGERH